MAKILFYLLALKMIVESKYYLNGTVYNESGTLIMKPNIMDCNNGVVCGYFNASINETGWHSLEIKTNKNNELSQVIKMEAVGILEGYLTSYEIFLTYTTIFEAIGEDLLPFFPEYKKFMDQQKVWINDNYNNNKNDPYWQYIQGLINQLNGMYTGYMQAYNDKLFSLPKLDIFNFELLASETDLIDVSIAVIVQDLVRKGEYTRNNVEKRLKEHKWIWSMHTGQRCSGYIKIDPEISELYFSHDTWSNYFFMNRIYKYYILDDVSVSMSSYPGSLSSVDDYYVLSTGLAVMETTNSVWNYDLYKLIQPESLFTWQRAMVANVYGKNGPNWVEIFSKYNSGTYNNQWMVLDYNLFKPNEPLSDNLLWIAEQIPGNVSSMDVTGILERGYWASYNVPSIEYIYNTSGWYEYEQIEGTPSSYDLAPRARIFRRDANKPSNMTSVMKLMRYNDYLNDKIENNDPMWAIMSRGDLKNDDPSAFGAIDSKLTNSVLMKDMISYINAGPTHDNLPVFSWKQFDDVPHYGMPITMDYDWIQISSQLL